MEKLNFKKGISILLKDNNMTIPELAIESSVPIDIIDAIIDGACNPSKDIVKRIASAFNISPEVLLYLSLDEIHIPEDKRELYKELNPLIIDLLLKLSKDDV